MFSFVLLLVRCCLAAPFLVSGIHKAGWYSKALEEWRHARVPAFTLPLTIALHLVGSAALITGLYAQPAALALAVFTLIATLRVHTFWNMQGNERLGRSRAAVGNVAIIGGLLLLWLVGPGNLSW